MRKKYIYMFIFKHFMHPKIPGIFGSADDAEPFQAKLEIS